MQKKKRSKAPGIIAAVIILIVVLAIAFSDSSDDNGASRGEGNLSVEAYSDKPPGRDVPFEIGEAGFSTNDPNIRMIEINQSLSYGFDTNNGQFYVMENFVAGKETAIFIDFEEPPRADSEMILTIEKNGQYVASLAPFALVGDRTVLFQPRDISETGYWDQGAYTFTFDMDESQAVRTTNFFDSMPLKVLAVPILANYSGRIIGVDGDWRNGSAMITAAYPVAKKDVDYVLHPELDLTDRRFDLDTDDGMFNVWDALRNLQTPTNDYTLIVGYIRYPANHGQFLGYTYGLPANIVCESEPDMLATVVHEIAHCYLIGDEYNGGSLNTELNSPPYKMQGHDIITRQPAEGIKEAVVGGFSVGINGSGSVIYPEQRAYWIEGQKLLGAVTSYMGAGTGEDSFRFWTTSDIWNHLFSVFTGQIPMVTLGGGGGGGGSGGSGEYGGGEYDDDYWGQCPNCYSGVYDPPFFIQCRTCYEYAEIFGEEFDCEYCGSHISLNDYYDDELALGCWTCYSLILWPEFLEFNSGGYGKEAAEQGMIMVAEVTGCIGEDGTFDADPWYSYMAPISSLTASKEGGYSVSVYDRKGNTLSKTYFEVYPTAEYTTHDGQKMIENARIPINVVVKFPEGAAAISVQKDDTEIYSRTVSKNVPEVEIIGIEPYEDIGNNYTLNWEASDKDGDELYFDIYYCFGDEEYYLMESNTTGRSADLDFSDYPGTNEGYFYIYATDGINTAENFSEFIKVPFKAPEIYTDNKVIPQYVITQEINFEIDVYDKQDGWLTDEEVVWYLNGEEYWDSDTLFIWPYELEPGIHTFTVTATNSAGMSVSEEFSIEIIDDESGLPDDWSRDIVKYALMHGFYAPLSKLDAPITRTDFAYLMSNMFGYFSTWDDIYPDFEEGLIEDCTGNYYEPFLMVYLGLMDAPDGKFEPQKILTEEEAALIMYKTVALAIDPDAAEGFDDAEIIKKITGLGIFGLSPENVFDTENKLTYKLALVRCGLLLQALYEE